MLDGLRAMAVLAVILYHFKTPIPGDLGVTGFFVISGLLITWLLIREYHASGTIDLPRFYIRRTLRIFPAYYVFIFGSLALDTLLGYRWSAGLFFSAVFYVGNYYFAMHQHQGSIAHIWSLAIEEQFYLLWPVTLRWALRRGLAFVRRFLTFVIVVVAAWRSLLYLGFDVSHYYVYDAFETRADSLAIGCLMAAAIGTDALERLAGWIARYPWLPLVTLALVTWSRNHTSATWHYSVGFTVDSLLLGALILQLMVWHRHPLWRWLDAAPVRYVGRISYPLYLWHGYGLAVANRVPGPTVVRALVAIGVGIAIASVSYYVIERPMLRLKERFEPTRAAL